MSLRRALALGAAAVLAGCALDPARIREAQVEVDAARETRLDCDRADRCALPTPLRALLPASGAAQGHHVVLLDAGEPSLALRVHLIRAARERIDLQTFIFAEDDTGYLTLSELLRAARRGVKVRVLIDQLFALDDVQLLAKLAREHVNFELELYNPTFHRARTDPLSFAAGIVCCFTRFNQRMHNKLLLVDGVYGIVGGRNVEDRYFDLDPAFNYRDRDVLVVGGPATAQMQENFERYWAHPKSVALAALRDVNAALRNGVARSDAPAPTLRHAERIAAISWRAEDSDFIREQFVAQAFPVARVDYFADLPNKRFERHPDHDRDLQRRIQGLFRAARREILLQTPYLVISRTARELLRAQRGRHPDLRVRVSTNSLASTDAFYVYALSHKHKRTYLEELGFEIHEYKPFPATEPRSELAPPPAALGYRGRLGVSRRVRARPVPLQHTGARRGLHAKSIVIDEQVALIGTHNFDPRSDRYNTESGVIIHDAAFARALARSIRIDMAAENAWVIGPRQRALPVVGHVNTAIARVSEELPLFDLWPFRYATSYERREGCEPVPPLDPRFHECHEPVGDFPEVNLTLKNIYTRIITAFGLPLTPIL